MKIIVTYPNLFIIGLPKAGTSTLHEMLISHPEICGSSLLKDRHFYNSEELFSELSLLMKSYSGQQYQIDTGATYSFYSSSLERIKKTSPNAKLLLMLRHPVDRTISDFYFRRKYGRISLTENEILNSPNKRKLLGSMYELILIGHHIKRIYKIFNKEQVEILFFEDLVGNPTKTLNQIFDFLSIEKMNIDLQHKNKTGRNRMPVITKLVRGRYAFKSFFSIMLPKAVRVKLANFIVRLNTIEIKEERLLHELKEEMYDWFQDDLHLASDLTGLNFHEIYKRNY